MFQQSRKARRGQDKTSQLLEWSLRAIRRSRQANFIEVLKAAGYEAHDSDEDVLRVFVPGATDDSTKVLFALAAQERVQVRHLRPSIPTLEDVFARAVGDH